jgi:hypothetical protein
MLLISFHLFHLIILIMRTFTHMLIILALALLISCRGEQGPPGPPGEDGFDGTSLLGSVFEIEGDFIPENEFSLYFEFPNTLEVYESDVVLVYLLWEVTDDDLDVWRLLPQTIILDEGILQYNFDYTYVDVRIFLDGNIDFNTLLPAEALGQVFRIVVLPADFAKNTAIDINDYNAMMKTLGLNPDAAIKLEVTDPLKMNSK